MVEGRLAPPVRPRMTLAWLPKRRRQSRVLFTGRPPLRTAVDAAALENRELRPATGTDPSRVLVGCGAPSGSDVLIVDPDTGRALPEGHVGEIWLSGPCVTAGYWENEHVTEATFRARTDINPLETWTASSGMSSSRMRRPSTAHCPMSPSFRW